MTSPRGISDVTTRDAVRLTEFLLAILILTFSAQTAVSQASPAANAAPTTPICDPTELGSPYIPVDSWVYPAMLRLYSLGFVDHVYLNMRPWTRSSMSHMLEDAQAHLENAEAGPANDQAQEIYEALLHELQPDLNGPCGFLKPDTRVESVYEVGRAISGTPLHDSYHLGSTVINDYGRPFENGFNNYTGASAYATAGRFVLHVRGEFQYAGSATGYSTSLAQALSNVDQVPFLNPTTGVPFNQATIPMGPIGTATNGRLLEAYASYLLGSHEISIGKQDEWMGPGLGGAMAFSNNAQTNYAFHINRVEPLRIPLLSSVTGPFRYEFLVGP
jgi:hypothetical protein